ncbi:hypothetical protein WJX72_008061 [[Myrmecia] bisecta]|uniref:Sugar phosphate transporter domain-containing protein n=1 Tax=[Myrmecia] bisecta TaxID=41462 RepID=A0AAW1PY38_9CHLO
MSPAAAHRRCEAAMVDWVRPAAYGISNIVAAISIVMANKLVLSIYKFEFTYALTLIHTLTTMAGMILFASLGMFQPKAVPRLAVAPLAAAYVGYVVFNNLSLKLNTVGFYQISKISITPVVLIIEILLFRKYPTRSELAAVLVVCLGVAMATVTDTQLGSNYMGILVGFAAVGVTAIYQVWAGSKQKELQVGSMQMLHEYSPLAALMLGVLVPVLEPLGLHSPRDPQTIVGFPYSLPSVAAIAVSALLGLAVSLSTFLVIGATSSLTYNVCGHVKTIAILAGGVLFFGDAMPAKKLMGIAVAMSGIVWYSRLKLQAAALMAKATDMLVTNKKDDLESLRAELLRARV